MSIATPNQHGPDDDRGSPLAENLGLAVGLLAFVVMLGMPTPQGMPLAAQRLASVTVLMAILWVAQAAPIAVTALIPVAAYPLLGIQSAARVSQSYINANVFLYLGGFVIALGIEKWGLHRRIALHVVQRIGSSPRRIVLGFMVATGFLSMWISNTASSMLMLPIAIALLRTLTELRSPRSTAETPGVSTSSSSSRAEEAQIVGTTSSLPTRHQASGQSDPIIHRLGVALMLAIAYGASCGGVSTLVGTPTNVQFLGIWKESAFAGDIPAPSMAQWMLCFAPLSVLLLAAAFLVLTWGLPRGRDTYDPGRGFFKDRIRELGPPSTGERLMLVIFAATAALWIFRAPVTVETQRFGTVTLLPGWGPVYEQWLIERLGVDKDIALGAIHDATVAMTMAVLMFLLPLRTREGRWTRLMDWETTESGMPWGILLLFGGGFAMANAFSDSGLSAWLGETLAANLNDVSPVVLVLTTCLLMTFLTEFTSNVATVSTIVPILGAAAVSLQLDPRLMVIPATVTASCAFMLPIATPPNAIVFASGRISMRQMMAHGLLLNLAGVLLVTLVTFTLLAPIMGVSLDGM